MRIIVISDTHRDFFSFQRLVEKHLADADCFLVLGDGEAEYDNIVNLYAYKEFHYVRGNCDFVSQAPNYAVYPAGKHRIFYTHGHLYHVKAGLDRLTHAAKERECDIVLFGHTHTALSFYEDGIYIMNPGSPSHPRNSKAGYGIIDTTSAGIVTNLVPMDTVPFL